MSECSTRYFRRAFTLIELLVVVAIIALLIAILLPSLAKAREMTKRTTCAANLKAQGTSCAIYAASFNDLLPNDGSTAAGIGWLWDEYDFWGDQLLQVNPANFTNGNSNSMTNMSLRKLFYCPSNTGQNVDGLWTYNSVRVMGYAYFNDRSGMTDLISFNKTRPNPQSYLKKFSTTPRSSTTELAFDAIIQSGDGGSYTSVKGGFAVPHTTSHISGSTPTGQNVMSCDAHVEWRTFKEVNAVWAIVPGFPHFWLVNQ